MPHDSGYELIGLSDYTSISSATSNNNNSNNTVLVNKSNIITSITTNLIQHTLKQFNHVLHTLNELVSNNDTVQSDDTLYNTIVYTPNEIDDYDSNNDNIIHDVSNIQHTQSNHTSDTANNDIPSTIQQSDAYQLLDSWRTSNTLLLLSPNNTISNQLIQPINNTLSYLFQWNINTSYHTKYNDNNNNNNNNTNTLRNDIQLALRCWSLERHLYTLPIQWIYSSINGIELDGMITTQYAIIDDTHIDNNTFNTDDRDIETTLHINYDPLQQLHSWLSSSIILKLTNQFRYDIALALEQWRVERLYRLQYNNDKTEKQ